MIKTDTAIADITKGIDLDAFLWEGTAPWSISRGQIWARVDNYSDDPLLEVEVFNTILNGVIAHCATKGVLRD